MSALCSTRRDYCLSQTVVALVGLPCSLVPFDVMVMTFPSLENRSPRINHFTCFLRCRRGCVRVDALDGNGICPIRESRPGNRGILAVIVGRVAVRYTASVPSDSRRSYTSRHRLVLERSTYALWCLSGGTEFRLCDVKLPCANERDCFGPASSHSQSKPKR